MNFINKSGAWFQTSLNDTWNWLNQLNYQEWFVVLGIVGCLGFLCMRGYGSRSNR